MKEHRVLPEVVFFWLVVLLMIGTTALMSLKLRGAEQAHKPAPTPVEKIRPVDIRWDKRTVAVSNENNHTLTLLPGGHSEEWVCAAYEHGRSCKPMGKVVAWLLAWGER